MSSETVIVLSCCESSCRSICEEDADMLHLMSILDLRSCRLCVYNVPVLLVLKTCIPFNI